MKTIKLEKIGTGMKVEIDENIEAGEAIYMGVRFLAGLYAQLDTRKGSKTKEGYINDIVMGLDGMIKEDEPDSNAKAEEEEPRTEVEEDATAKSREELDGVYATITVDINDVGVGVNVPKNLTVEDAEYAIQAFELSLRDYMEGKGKK